MEGSALPVQFNHTVKNYRASETLVLGWADTSFKGGFFMLYQKQYDYLGSKVITKS